VSAAEVQSGVGIETTEIGDEIAAVMIGIVTAKIIERKGPTKIRLRLLQLLRHHQPRFLYHSACRSSLNLL
jgi:hypothetical protein